MSQSFLSINDLLDAPFDTVIDVRAPSEFAVDHIPGAINLPVLDDAERARVGIIYKQQSPFLARKLGAALVARNAAAHIEGPLAEKPGGWQPLIYCWRGGQRSNSFAIILRQIGWRVAVLEGGYKSWRRMVITQLHDQPLPHRFVLLDGFTGTAKTELLARVAARGGQVLDLEGLAQHRGSLFGAQGSQPAQTGFESQIAAALARLDPTRPVLVEAESSRIGRLSVPAQLWQAMCRAPRIDVQAAVQARAAYLVEAYRDVVEDAAGLEARLTQLVPLQGREQVARWLGMAQTQDYVQLAADLMQRHYDPRYARSRARHAPDIRARVDLGDMSVGAQEQAADRLCALLTDF